eukprot:6465512-Amphidinium_carterae.1
MQGRNEKSTTSAYSRMQWRSVDIADAPTSTPPSTDHKFFPSSCEHKLEPMGEGLPVPPPLTSSQVATACTHKRHCETHARCHAAMLVWLHRKE